MQQSALLGGEKSTEKQFKLPEIMAAISEGANAFLFKEYVYIAWFCLGFGIVVMLAIGGGLYRDGAGNFGDGAMAMVRTFTCT